MFPANPQKYALCVGVSYKGQEGPYEQLAEDFQLLGVQNDVKGIRGLLTGLYDYKEENIEVLLDDDLHRSPTRDNILAAMKDLVGKAKAGDHLFFFFAGHGDQITNLDGTETDGKDEIILPIDWKLDPKLPKDNRYRYKQIIIDDEMNEILVQNLPDDCRLTALFDSCHSGTMLDLPYERSWGPRSPDQPRSLFPGPRVESPIPEEMPVHHENTRLYHDDLNEEGTAIQNVSRAGSTDRVDIRLYHDDLNEEGTPIQNVSREGSTDRVHINRLTRKNPLELSFVLAHIPRGRTHPHWREGTWLLRGETRDGNLIPQPSLAKKRAISWSSCSDGQNGYEMKSKHENRSGGVMVRAFVDILTENPYRTYRNILECLGERLRNACEAINRNQNRAERIMQEPQLGSQQKPNLDNLYVP